MTANVKSAYQFNPKEVSLLSDDELRQVIGSIMKRPHDVDSAHIENNVLTIVFYVDCGRGLFHKQTFTLNRGDWLIISEATDGRATVVENYAYRIERLEEKIRGWFRK